MFIDIKSVINASFIPYHDGYSMKAQVFEVGKNKEVYKIKRVDGTEGLLNILFPKVLSYDHVTGYTILSNGRRFITKNVINKIPEDLPSWPIKES